MERSNTQEDTLDKNDLQELKRIRLLDLKLWSILQEVVFFLVFLFFLYVVSILNYSNSAFNYNQLFISTFVEPQSQYEIALYDVILFKK